MKKKTVFWTLIMLAMLVWGLPGRVQVDAASKYVIYVNRSSNIVNVVRRSSGRVVRSMYCSTGRGYATPAGTFYIGEKYRWHALYQGHYGQYCSRITGHVLFHSVPACAWSTKAVPTKAFNQLGTQASMGCVRLACGDAYWIYKNCRSGTKVVIGESRKLKKPAYSKILMSTKKKFNWDPTDPNKNNPYRPSLKKSKTGKKAIPYGSAVDVRNLIKVKSQVTSTKLLLKHLKIKGKINSKKPGKYKVKVTVKDPRSRLSRTKTFTFKVAKPETTPEASGAAVKANGTTETQAVADEVGKAEEKTEKKAVGTKAGTGKKEADKTAVNKTKAAAGKKTGAKQPAEKKTVKKETKAAAGKKTDTKQPAKKKTVKKETKAQADKKADTKKIAKKKTGKGKAAKKKTANNKTTKKKTAKKKNAKKQTAKKKIAKKETAKKKTAKKAAAGMNQAKE